jgi:hypothetical protein
MVGTFGATKLLTSWQASEGEGKGDHSFIILFKSIYLNDPKTY